MIPMQGCAARLLRRAEPPERKMLALISECRATLNGLTSFAQDEPLWKLSTGSKLSMPSVIAPRYSL